MPLSCVVEAFWGTGIDFIVQRDPFQTSENVRSPAGMALW
jgi:hypothetical protein